MVDSEVNRGPACVILLYVSGDERRFVPLAAELSGSRPHRTVVAAAEEQQLAAFADLDLERTAAPSAREAVNALWARERCHVFAITDAVELPNGTLARALSMLDADLRYCTISFFSNGAGNLSFPSDHPAPATPPGFDHQSLTDRLRELSPPVPPCPVSFAAGAAVLISGAALSAVGLLEAAPDGSFETSLADFSLRGRERGFVDLLDPETYVFRPPAPGVGTPGDSRADDQWLRRRHPQLIDAFEHEADAGTPVKLVRRVAVAKAFGLRVLIDDATLGPYETGAQITTLAIIDALAKHPEVAEVGVALSSHMPHYAKAVLSQPKVNVGLRVGANYGAFNDFDVLHRTAQPDRDFDVEAARRVARRVIVSVLDLIAYRAGSYHATGDDWVAYRQSLRDAVRGADGVTTISNDVAAVALQERLPVETDRLFPILYGTEHLNGHEEAVFPAELAECIGNDFIFCLGTDYAHKNRDLAIATQRELRARSRDVLLVLAGPSVPYGGSRNAEKQLLRGGSEGVIFLPNVSSRERNWLFRHAAAVLYPTSAEGFGLVPFEAARFGSPTVTVGFGPLLETLAEVPVAASSWDSSQMADCIERLMDDPLLRRQQVSGTLAAADRYSWRRTANEFVGMYRALLARPTRWEPRPVESL